MRPFTMVSPSLWKSKRFRSLSDTGKLLYNYLLTGPQQTPIGVFQMDDGYASADLAWTTETLSAARSELINAELIAFDPDRGILAIRGWFKFNPVWNGNHHKGAIRQIAELAPSPIHAVVLDEYYKAMEASGSSVPSRLARDQKASAAAAALSGKWAVRTSRFNR